MHMECEIFISKKYRFFTGSDLSLEIIHFCLFISLTHSVCMYGRISDYMRFNRHLVSIRMLPQQKSPIVQ